MARLIHIGFIGNIASKSLREKYTGALRYEAEHPDVTVEEFNPVPFSLETSHHLIGQWAPDALILPAPDAYSYVQGVSGDIPLGLIDDYDDHVDDPDVRFVLRADESSLAQAVARHYLKRNFRSFAYIGYADKPRSQHREREFARTIRQAGHPVDVFHTHWSNQGRMSDSESTRFHAWLGTLSFPCAAFVYWDNLAKHVLVACTESGIKVPDQLSIIGIDNDELICENTRPSLSSVELDSQSAGYEAAKRLHAIVIGKARFQRSARPVYGMSRIVERVSSSDVEGSARIITQAKELIRTKACDGLTPARLARELNISQRYLETKFKTVLGTTACLEIQKRRLDEAKKLLSRTQLPFAEIARKSGFSTLHHLQNIFSAQTGCPMRTYRQKSA